MKQLNRQDYKIHIVGAGVSGLVAAIELEKSGYKPVIIEASDSVGGRVKTDFTEEFQFDHGFQVLLEAYPMAKTYLDYQSLDVQKLHPGAVVFRKGRAEMIGDASRKLSFLWGSIRSSVGSFSDKLRVFSLNRQLKKKSIDEIFSDEEKTTHDYLKAYGFSERMISRFFKPFFTGIFLEPALQTSSRMFEFVYKMFGSGLALIPREGIGAISEQLRERFKHTEIRFNTEVQSVKDDKIILSDGTELETHFTIIATSPDGLIGNLKGQQLKWKSCYNLYFRTNKKVINGPVIGLIADQEALINNIFYHTSIGLKTRKPNGDLLSVTVVKEHDYDHDGLVERVQEDLKQYCGIEETSFLRVYHIPRALPDLKNVEYDIQPMSTRIKPTIFLAGDQLLNGSLNAAMLSGERAAQGIIAALEDGLVVDNLTSEYINDR